MELSKAVLCPLSPQSALSQLWTRNRLYSIFCLFPIRNVPSLEKKSTEFQRWVTESGVILFFFSVKYLWMASVVLKIIHGKTYGWHHRYRYISDVFHTLEKHLISNFHGRHYRWHRQWWKFSTVFHKVWRNKMWLEFQSHLYPGDRQKLERPIKKCQRVFWSNI